MFDTDAVLKRLSFIRPSATPRLSLASRCAIVAATLGLAFSSVLANGEAAAASSPPNVSMDSMSYGYALHVKVNGTDLGLVGQKSESVRLFRINDPICAQMPKTAAQSHCVLRSGKNQVQVSYERKSDAGMSIEFMVPDAKDPVKPVSLLKFDEPKPAKGTLSGEFKL